MNLEKYPELVDSLASSYALGSMRGLARRRFETLARERPTIRAAVLLWQERLASFTEIQTEVRPSENVWKRIELVLEDEQRTLAPKPTPVTERMLAQGVEKLRRALSWWRGAALAGALAAVVAVVIIAPWRVNPELQFVAVLADDQSAANLLLRFDSKQNALHVQRVGQYREAADKSLQLWALPPGAPPRSLGVLSEGQDLKLILSGRKDLAVPLLAVSLEPKGGVPSATGPTGPVLFKGLVAQF
jgi:anti-sigma-K factor RskA